MYADTIRIKSTIYCFEKVRDATFGDGLVMDKIQPSPFYIVNIENIRCYWWWSEGSKYFFNIL